MSDPSRPSADPSVSAIDQLFSKKWTEIGTVIAKALETGRKASPYACAEITLVPEESATAPWQGDVVEPVQSDHGLPRRTSPSMVIVAERKSEWRPTTGNELLNEVADMAEHVVAKERDELIRVLTAAQESLPAASSPAALDSLGKVTVPADIILNSHLGSNVAFSPKSVKRQFQGKIVSSSLGADQGHLAIEKGTLAIFKAGGFRYKRPTADSFEIEVVFAAHVLRDESVWRFATR